MDAAGIRSLVVEGEAGTRRLLQDVLRTRGHHVDACADAETGWVSYRRERPSLLLLDLNLTGFDGVEFCRRVRRVPDEEAVVLVVTGVEERTELERALEAGADDYLPTPLNDQQLHVRLRIAERRVRELRERREAEEHLRRDAFHDRLTGLANRTVLEERIEHAARRTRREENYLFAVLAVDIRGFSSLNRRLGREGGDEVLREVARRLESCVRSIDTVARLSSDRFAILLDGLHDPSDPTRVATRVNQALSVSLDVDGEEVHPAGNMGIALSAAGYERGADILRDAQSALDQAKTEGPGAYRIYDPVMHAKAVARVELESRIRGGLEEGEMELYYQPLVRLETGQIAGFEALIRWNDPDRGLVEPDEFIGVAEGSGLIVALGSWVLDRAVERLDEWREVDLEGGPPFLSVNVSGRQVAQPDLANQIADRLERLHLPGGFLHLEITETSLMENVETATRMLSDLKNRSVGVHVDDFGTGYSSLSYLCRLPIDTLKVDRSFVTQMTQSPENLEVVRTIVRLGRNLGMSIIAEGVETERQLEVLKELECDLAQGFLFSRPVDLEGAWKLLEDPAFA